MVWSLKLLDKKSQVNIWEVINKDALRICSLGFAQITQFNISGNELLTAQ